MDIPEWVVTSVKPKDDYMLEVSFYDGKKKIVDMKPVIAQGKIFSKLQDKNFFSKARVALDTVVWSDEIDIAPEYLYENGVDIK